MSQDDYVLFVLIVIAVWIVAQAIMALWPRGRRHLMERPVDVHGAIYRARRRAARRNIRGQPQKIICAGEADYPGMTYGRLYGIISGPYSDELFITTSRARPPMWTCVPKELIRDKHGVNIVVECNGFEPVANFYIPIYCSDTPTELIERYNRDIMDHEAYLVQREKYVELAEQGAHAMKDALSVRGLNTAIRDRQESVRVVQDKGGERYDERVLE